jgi:hypothetical protein
LELALPDSRLVSNFIARLSRRTTGAILMRNLFSCKAREAVAHPSTILERDSKSAAEIAWILVGGAIIATVLILAVREIPAMIREARIMRM